MSTRLTSSTSSRRAKQKLVQLLFGPTYSRKGPGAHRQLDPASYSYAELRSAYLKKLQDIHPDKFAHKKQDQDYFGRRAGVAESAGSYVQSSSEREDVHHKFVELQEAWDGYEAMAKMMKRVGKGDATDANFTMFGVGCSFADSPSERELRSKITDEACRGWFTAGVLPERTSTHEEEASNLSNESDRISLCDDDLFVSDSETGSDDNNIANGRGQSSTYQPNNGRQRKSLIDHAFPGGKCPMR